MSQYANVSSLNRWRVVIGCGSRKLKATTERIAKMAAVLNQYNVRILIHGDQAGGDWCWDQAASTDDLIQVVRCPVSMAQLTAGGPTAYRERNAFMESLAKLLTLAAPPPLVLATMAQGNGTRHMIALGQAAGFAIEVIHV